MDGQGVGRIIGYVRVSTVDQKLDLQLDALKAIGATKTFTDQASGSRTARPGLDRCLKELTVGDTLAVWKLDRLGRSLAHLLQTVEGLRLRGVGIRSITENIDTTTSHGRLLLGLFGTLAQFERDLIRERIAAGTVAARARGQRFGRRPSLTASQVEMARRELSSGRKGKDVARDLGIARSTLYALLASADALPTRETVEDEVIALSKVKAPARQRQARFARAE